MFSFPVLGGLFSAYRSDFICASFFIQLLTLLQRARE